MVGDARLRAYIDKAEVELTENILPFWIRHAVDTKMGGFYGEVSNTLRVDEKAPKGALLCARILWTFSAAYKRYHKQEVLDMARWAYNDLVAHFWDKEYSGLYWMADAEGNPINTRKQIYGQAFGIYALAEYFGATGDDEALRGAIALFRAIEDHSYDQENKGYFEAYTRDWRLEDDLRLSDADMNEKKSMNTHLHLMEAYTNLMRVWDDAELGRKHAELIKVMMQHIVNPETYHALTFFDEHWNVKSDRVSFGHDIEMSWLLVEAAEVSGKRRLIEAARTLSVHMAQAVYTEALDAAGGLVYEADPDGIVNTDREWWSQAEAVVGFINAYQISSRPHFLDAALKVWDYIEHCIVDSEYGEWFRCVTREGIVGGDGLKVSFWKCPYHNGRACMEMADRLKALV